MGTRSQTIFIETYTDEKTNKKKATKICMMYRQFDGYPSGHGIELAKFLKDGRLVNGLSINNPKKTFNGMGCLTAQVIAHFKRGAGGIYIENPDTTFCGDYVYEVEGDFDTKEMILRCFEVDNNYETNKSSKGKKLFEGHPKDFKKFVKKEEKTEA